MPDGVLDQLEAKVNEISSGGGGGTAPDAAPAPAPAPIMSTDTGAPSASGAPTDATSAPASDTLPTESTAPESTAEPETTEETTGEQAQEGGEETGGGAPAAAAPVQGEDATTPLGIAHKAVEDAKAEILASTRKFGLIKRSDQKPMADFKGAIQNLARAMEAKVPNDPGDYAFALGDIIISYQKLINSCDAYIASINSKRFKKSQEKHNTELAQKIKAQCETELGFYNVIKGQFATGGMPQGISWLGVLYTIRAEDLRDKTLETVGAGTSTISVRVHENGDKDYIKPEEKTMLDRTVPTRLEAYKSSSGADPTVVAYVDSVLQIENEEIKVQTFSHIQDVSEELFNSIIADSKKEREDKIQELYSKIDIGGLKAAPPEMVYDFISFMYKKFSEYNTADKAGIKPGSTVSDRNASSSRVAEAMGITDIVAKSETVMATDAEGNTVRANSMEGAKGKSMGDLGNYCLEKNIPLDISPNAARQLFELQVFDAITGQVDRHAGNYMVSYDEIGNPTEAITVTAIKAIDNDMAFGEFDLEQLTSSRGYMPLVQSYTGKSAIPALTREFYNRIMDPAFESALVIGQLDLRTVPEIEALLGRYRTVREQLKALTEGENPKLAIVDSEEEFKVKYQEFIENMTPDPNDPLNKQKRKFATSLVSREMWSI